MKLFEPVTIGNLKLSNRIVMAPLTRTRAGEERIPNKLMQEYYTQRATAGLILTEATAVSPQGVGYAHTPGIWSEAQVEGWKNITDSVHKAGGRIFLQLWHVGRVSDPVFLQGELPVAPSAIAPKGHVSLVRPEKSYVTPRALRLEEIPGIVADFRKGAENAKRAGFDGVEVHGANGYLVDQFLQSGTNIRTDQYGGSVENRARFFLEVIDAAISVWGPERVGAHIAPKSDAHDMSDANPRETFLHLARELGKRKIAFIFARENLGAGRLGPEIKRAFGGHLIANKGISLEDAEGLLRKEEADLVSFGKLFIANPDLVERLKKKASLNQPDPSTFYGSGPKGYVDYPSAN